MANATRPRPPRGGVGSRSVAVVMHRLFLGHLHTGTTGKYAKQALTEVSREWFKYTRDLTLRGAIQDFLRRHQASKPPWRTDLYTSAEDSAQRCSSAFLPCE